MAFAGHLSEWGGKKVEDWDLDKGITDPENTAYAIRAHRSGPDWMDTWAAFIADPRFSEVTGLVIGLWNNRYHNSQADATISAIVAAADRLPNLTTLFFGDITYDENEVSWILQGDVSPFFAAFPKLEYLGARGGSGLSLGIPHHTTLKKLVIQTGGLPETVVEEVTAAELPALEHLELWLGTEEYGAGTTAEHAQALLNAIPTRFPKLTYLGLCNSDISDDIAKAIATSPVLDQLETLDLSSGVLSDEGGEALLSSDGVKTLKKLDLHFHYLSEEMAEKLQALPIEVDTSDPQESEEDGDEVWRYVSVGE
jgi:hypothetical protein